MNNLNILFILTILLIFCISLYSYYYKQYSDITIVKSTLDNNEYLVRKLNSTFSAVEAANILATLAKIATNFIANLNEKYKEKIEITTKNSENNENSGNNENSENGENAENSENENKIFIKRLTKNFNPNSLSESSSYHTGTSYSLNKGEKIVLCLRQKGDNSFVDMNTLMFVFLHELTHLGTIESKTHSPIFDRNFKFILKEAIDQNIYSFQDYNNYPVIYCGKPISQTPLK